jgi:hypothetical protein
MNIHAFVTKFLREYQNSATPLDGQGHWTEFIRAILHKISRSFDYYCCCQGLHDDDGHGMRREFLWDLTWYAKEGGELDLPEVVIEHENAHNHQEFFADFWKIMAAFAPVRIMVGYTSPKGIDDRKEWIRHVVTKQGWTFPPQSTDMIILKAYGPSAPVFFIRTPGEAAFHPYETPPTWKDLAGCAT